MLPVSSPASAPPQPIPLLIQGGMGVAVSGWRLANAVAQAGGLGVVSGTAIEIVHARLLGDGDPGGHLRRAYGKFPNQGLVERVLERWFVEDGRPYGRKYRNVPLGDVESPAALRELIVLANFGEVHLAKDGHGGPIGVNFLEKIQLPTPEGIYGTMLAGVDVVLMGAGIPAGVPRLLRALAEGSPVEYALSVADSTRPHHVRFDPASVAVSGGAPTIERPRFLAIISSNTLAAFLLKDPETAPDGFVVEASTAGGHNAPPRGKLVLDEAGEPVYGPRDSVDLAKLSECGKPFWVAGGIDDPRKVTAALEAGAAGVQIGTPFALCEESGMDPDLRHQLLDAARDGGLIVRTDPRASPSGYPFKVAQLAGTISDPDVYLSRRRVCDIGLLRSPYEKEDGTVGWRCPAEPVKAYLSKGGAVEDTEGRACLCNGLVATAGFGQERRGRTEPPIVTIGDDATSIVAALGDGRDSWSAAEVVAWLTSGVAHTAAVTRDMTPVSWGASPNG